MEKKEQNQELGWRVSVLPIPEPIPAFHCMYIVYLQHIIIISHSGGMQEWVIQIPSLFGLFYAHAHETPTSFIS